MPQQRLARPAVLGPAEGEYRMLLGRKPILLKIDPATLGSQHLFLGTEVIPPHDSVSRHRHLEEEEALFLHRGTLDVALADQRVLAGPGSTVYIPVRTWISFRNPGPDTAEIVYVFNEPAFALCLRALSAPRGEPYRALGVDSMAKVRQACHQERPGGV